MPAPRYAAVRNIAQNRRAWSLFATKDNPIQLTSIEDAKGYRIGANQGEAVHAWLEGKGIKVDTVNSVDGDKKNLRKLQEGHIDFWATGKWRGIYYTAKHGGPDLKQALLLKEVDIYLACNKSVPDNLIDKLNVEIKAMTDDGSIAAMSRAYQ